MHIMHPHLLQRYYLKLEDNECLRILNWLIAHFDLGVISMSQQINIVLKDSDATTDLTLYPVSNSGGVSIWRSRKSGVPIGGQVQIEVRVNPSRPGLPTRRVRVKTMIPYMETITGSNSNGYTAAPKVAYTNIHNQEYLIHERSDYNAANFLRQLGLQCVDNVVYHSAVVNSTTDNIIDAILQGSAPV